MASSRVSRSCVSEAVSGVVGIGGLHKGERKEARNDDPFMVKSENQNNVNENYELVCGQGGLTINLGCHSPSFEPSVWVLITLLGQT